MGGCPPVEPHHKRIDVGRRQAHDFPRASSLNKVFYGSWEFFGPREA
jgi:hypothetical protein